VEVLFVCFCLFVGGRFMKSVKSEVVSRSVYFVVDESDRHVGGWVVGSGLLFQRLLVCEISGLFVSLFARWSVLHNQFHTYS
jgi:hypothetical protein